MSGLLITVLLKGQISGFVKHTSRQKHSVKVSDTEYVSKIILHSDRKETPCGRTFTVDENVVEYWTSNNVPEWTTEKMWKSFSNHQRILSYLMGFDEGYGVEYEYLS